ncbi:hypothetical protein SLS60_012114, partial [Paraconiothyrium brasiliense]
MQSISTNYAHSSHSSHTPIREQSLDQNADETMLDQDMEAQDLTLPDDDEPIDMDRFELLRQEVEQERNLAEGAAAGLAPVDYGQSDVQFTGRPTPQELLVPNVPAGDMKAAVTLAPYLGLNTTQTRALTKHKKLTAIVATHIRAAAARDFKSADFLTVAARLNSTSAANYLGIEMREVRTHFGNPIDLFTWTIRQLQFTLFGDNGILATVGIHPSRHFSRAWAVFIWLKRTLNIGAKKAAKKATEDESHEAQRATSSKEGDHSTAELQVILNHMSEQEDEGTDGEDEQSLADENPIQLLGVGTDAPTKTVKDANGRSRLVIDEDADAAQSDAVMESDPDTDEEDPSSTRARLPGQPNTAKGSRPARKLLRFPKHTPDPRNPKAHLFLDGRVVGGEHIMEFVDGSYKGVDWVDNMAENPSFDPAAMNDGKNRSHARNVHVKHKFDALGTALEKATPDAGNPPPGRPPPGWNDDVVAARDAELSKRILDGEHDVAEELTKLREDRARVERSRRWAPVSLCLGQMDMAFVRKAMGTGANLVDQILRERAIGDAA